VIAEKREGGQLRESGIAAGNFNLFRLLPVATQFAPPEIIEPRNSIPLTEGSGIKPGTVQISWQER
jgi:hypothetical protein